MDNYQQIPKFKPIRLITIVLGIFILISVWMNWYTESVSLPRYCENSNQTLRYLEKILTERTPAEDNNHRPYLIAAKLIYLVPQKKDESIQNYLIRVERYIGKYCYR
jgi:hypothetical protein